MEVFFLFFEKANYPSAQPVMRMLHAKRSLRPVFVKGFDYKEHTGAIAPLVPEEDFATLDIDDFLGAEDAERAGAAAARDGELGLRALQPEDTFPSRAAHRLLQRELDTPAMPVILRRVGIASAAVRRFQRLRRPRIVVLPEDTDYVRGRLAAKLLRDAGTTVVVLAANFYNMFVRYPLVGPRYADHYLVMNADLQGRLLRTGIAADRISIVGSPAFDELAAVRARRHTPQVFLFAAQGLDSDHLVASDLIAVFRSLPEHRLLLKAHPEAAAEALPELPADLTNVQLLRTPVPVPSLLEQVSCVIAQTSTLLYQAILVGLPVIVPRYRPGPLEIHLPAQIAAGATACGRSELEGLVRRAAAGTLPQASPDAIQPPGFAATASAARKIEDLCAAL